MNISKGVKRKNVQVKEEIFDSIWNSLGKVLRDDENWDENQQTSSSVKEDDDHEQQRLKEEYEPLLKAEYEPLLNEENQSPSGKAKSTPINIVIKRNGLDVHVCLVDYRTNLVEPQEEYLVEHQSVHLNNSTNQFEVIFPLLFS